MSIGHSIEGDDHEEKLVDFFGEPVAFPKWKKEAEVAIRRRLAKLHLTDQGKIDAARGMIVAYLEESDPVRDTVYPTRAALWQAMSNHTWRIARARGIVAEL
jgi:hypothetical protein